MSTIQTNRLIPSKSAELNAQQYTAHSYGLISSAYTISTVDNIPQPGSIYAPGDALVFLGNDSTARYVFRDTSAASAAADGTNPLAVITDRYITASTTCRSARVTSGGDGVGANLTIGAFSPSPSSSDPTTFTLPSQAANGGTDQTTYMINTTQSCGPGCLPITAFEASLTAPWLYLCNVTISPVSNAVLLPQHSISDTVRRLAAGAIALQGVSTSSLTSNNSDAASVQFQTFPAEAFFGLSNNGSVSAMGLLLSQYAAGTVAAIAEANDQYRITGEGQMAPARGEVLTIKHGGIIMAILIGAVAAQLVLEVGVAVWAHRVAVPPDDVVAQAQVLRPLSAATGYIRKDRRAGHRKNIVTSSGSSRGSAGGESGAGGAEGEQVYEALWIYRVVPMGNSGLFDLHLERRDFLRCSGEHPCR